MFRVATFFLSLVLLFPFDSFSKDDEKKLPLPRFVSLRSDEVNLRTGPGIRYPIKWTIVKEGLPVEVIAEYEDWRKIRDISQDEGWAHKSMLSGTRTALVKANKKNIFLENNDKLKVIAVANKGTLLKVNNCDGFFCEVETKGVNGFIHQDVLYGIYEGEKFEK
jgi:SH3-like domain-containing protein